MDFTQELDDLFQTRKREEEEGNPMNMRPLVTMATTGILTFGLVLAANFAISRYEGDPLGDMYAENPKIYGPDMATLYRKRNEYCKPWWGQKIVAGFDAGTCMQKEQELQDYTSRVTYALHNDPGTVEKVKSQSFDVLATVYANGNKFRQAHQQKTEEGAQ